MLLELYLPTPAHLSDSQALAGACPEISKGRMRELDHGSRQMVYGGYSISMVLCLATHDVQDTVLRARAVCESTLCTETELGGFDDSDNSVRSQSASGAYTRIEE